jgi:pyrroline-5-carboxylate reductase
MSDSDAPPLLLIGGGRMGEALAAGLVRHGWAGDRMVVVESADARRDELARSGLSVAATVEEGLDRAAASADPAAPDVEPAGVGVVIAVKPYDVEPVCRDLARLAGARTKEAASPARALSIAAGVTLDDLDDWLDPVTALRAMPNTPALVGAAASAVAPGRRAAPADVEWAKDVLRAVGTVVELPEPSLDAVTGLSGSGPAYVFLMAEALIDAGVLAGLSRPVARDLAVQTLLGSARLLAETGDEPSALRAAVTSPGGTTAAGLRALEAAGLRAAVLDAVMAATERARELGRKH